MKGSDGISIADGSQYRVMGKGMVLAGGCPLPAAVCRVSGCRGGGTEEDCEGLWRRLREGLRFEPQQDVRLRRVYWARVHLDGLAAFAVSVERQSVVLWLRRND